MSWRSYIFPRILERFNTPYNKDVRVIEEHGKYKLLVHGSRQSGEYIKTLWQEALSSFGIIPSPDIKRILVLGVAGGTVIHMLHTIYPKAQIMGVDIDERMIAVGKKYFGLGGVNIVVDDARRFVKRSHKKWDLIVVDLFIGASIPPFVGEEEFLVQLKHMLVPGGKVLINYLYELEYIRLSDLFLVKLRKLFRKASDFRIYFNRFFFVVK